MDIGANFNTQNFEINTEALSQGFYDSYTENNPLLDPAEIRGIIQTYQQEHRIKQETLRKQKFEQNKIEGEKFLLQNSTKNDIVDTLVSGLQYKVILEGNGEIPIQTDRVRVHYTGKLIDGTIFDSSGDEPSEFGITQVIKGWTEALQLMNVGSKWEVYIPSSLGYGTRGKGQKIEPNTTLIFEIELLEVLK